jgi:murein DD-endopeptidase MepM/ murein hydrolase activator NlpD
LEEHDEATDLDRYLAQFPDEICYGGYLERRSIYEDSPGFHSAENRNIHLGIDIWLPAGSPIFAPIEGKIHSFADNQAYKDYGPTLILLHEGPISSFHVLFGHLSRGDLQDWEQDKVVKAGELIGHVGHRAENGGWPPHLHLQIILDMEGMLGDYPGVCAEGNLDHFRQNCPDPSWLLGLK